jgi:protein-S-isoprenylcysteine O-methyltransferase Ste14
MIAIDCKTCGAHLTSVHLGCPYCGTLVVPDRVLDARQEEELTLLAQNAEAKLQELKGRNDAVVIAVLLGGVAVTIGAYFLFRYLALSTAVLGVFVALVGAAMFLVFGWAIGLAEGRALDRAYHDQVKQELDVFLVTKGYFRCEFDMHASRVLPKNARLRRFLFGKPERLPPGLTHAA